MEEERETWENEKDDVRKRERRKRKRERGKKDESLSNFWNLN